MRHQDAMSALMNSAASMVGLGALNVNAMRPYIDKDGKSKVVANNGRGIVTNAPATLRYDEWKDIDRQVIAIATQRLVGIADLIGRGLTHSLGSVGQTVALWQQSSDMTGADVSMSGVTEGEMDTVNFNTASVPVPIIHKDFMVNFRRLEASRLFGEPLDTMQSGIAARVVAEKSEDMLFAGMPIQVDGGTIYGYMNHPNRNTVDLTEQWDAVGKTGAEILADVQAMILANKADRYYGPYTLYVPQGYEGVLDNDYNPATSDTRTIRQRIMMLDSIQDIKVVDRLTAHNVLLVQMVREVVDLAIAQSPTTVQWELMGGMQSRFKVMAIWVPRIKADYDGHSGICHLYDIP